MKDAISKYRQFHRKDPRAMGRLAFDEMPTHVIPLGDATFVLYRSDKIDPETGRQPREPINYIHDHEPGVVAYEPCDPDDDGAVEVPDQFRSIEALVLLGTFLGFAFVPVDGGEAAEVEASAPMPELYCTPDGRALVVVQSKREVLAMIWGGLLGVEARGIVG